LFVPFVTFSPAAFVDERCKGIVDTALLFEAAMAFACVICLGGASSSTAGAVSGDQAGNHRARKLAVELGWLWLRHQPGSDLSPWFRERVGDVKGRIQRIAIIAMARKLMVALWRYLETGVVPTGAVPRASF
jgi:hypothetical protein